MSKQIVLKLVFAISRKFNGFEIIFDSKQPHQRKFPKFWFLGFLGSKVWDKPIEWLWNILRKLNFDESKYFGLKYLPRTSKSNPKNPPSPRWVKLDRPLKQQLSNLDDLSVQGSTNRLIGPRLFSFTGLRSALVRVFKICLVRGPVHFFKNFANFSVRGSLLSVYLRIMYYVANISVFKQDLTRFHYYLQIRNDVIDGYITVGNDEATTLASLAIQAELGDYDPNEHTVEFFREFYLFPEALVQDNDETKHQHNIDQLR